MKTEYTLEGSQTVYTENLTTGKRVYSFLLFMIDDLNDCRFFTDKGVLTLDELCTMIGHKFSIDTLSLDIPDDEAAMLISHALGIPTGIKEKVHEGSSSQGVALPV